MFLRRGITAFLLVTNVAMGPLALVRPSVAFAASAADIQECQTVELDAYREATQTATDEFLATLTAQWERQVGFRVRAAAETRRKTVERALQTAWRKHRAELVKQLDAYRAKTHADDARLAEILRMQTGEAQEVALEKWSDAKLPSDAAIRASLASMERTLRLYANTRDRAIIKAVWADTLKEAFGDLTDEITQARGGAALGYTACATGETTNSADDETADADTSSSNWDETDATTAGAASTKATRDSAGTSPRTGTSGASRSTTPVIERARLFAATEAVAGSVCSASVSLRAELQGTPGAAVKGYFQFGNGSLNSPVSEFKFDAQGKAVTTFTQVFTGDASSATGRRISGVVKYVAYIAPAGAIVESDRVSYLYECPTPRSSSATPPSSPVAGAPATDSSSAGSSANSGSSSGSSAADSSSASTEALLTRVELSAATAAAMVEPCVANVTLRGQIRGRALTNVSGYFLFGDGTASPIYSVRLNELGSGVITHTQTQSLSRFATDRVISGVAKFMVFADSAKLESDRVTFRFECASSGAVNAPIPNSGAASVAGSGNSTPNTPAPAPSTNSDQNPASSSGFNSRSPSATSGSSVSDDGGSSSASAAGSTFRVTSTARIEGQSDVSTCGGHTFRFKGFLQPTIPGEVRYRWEFSDGAQGAEQRLMMAAGGAEVETEWYMASTFAGWARLKIVSPNEAYSLEVPVTLTQSCSKK